MNVLLVHVTDYVAMYNVMAGICRSDQSQDIQLQGTDHLCLCAHWSPLIKGLCNRHLKLRIT